MFPVFLSITANGFYIPLEIISEFVKYSWKYKRFCLLFLFNTLLTLHRKIKPKKKFFYTWKVLYSNIYFVVLLIIVL